METPQKDILLFSVIGMNESDEKSEGSYEVVLYNKDRNDPDNKILIEIQAGKKGRHLFLKMLKKKKIIDVAYYDDIEDRSLLGKPIALFAWFDSDGKFDYFEYTDNEYMEEGEDNASSSDDDSMEEGENNASSTNYSGSESVDDDSVEEGENNASSTNYSGSESVDDDSMEEGEKGSDGNL